MKTADAKPALKNEAIHAEFPILQRMVNGHKLVYLDNAASSQKPRMVLEAIQDYYSFDHSNVHRGVHFLSQLATQKYEDAREKLRGFIHAKSTKEILFTKGTTEGINLVAYGLSKNLLKPGDEILISEMEHHSNIVPWQIAAADSGAKLVVAKVDPDGSLNMTDFESKLSARTALVAIVHVSNALGTINPVEQITELAHQKDALVLIDGAQAIPHLEVNVQDLDCDFYAFSGHKMYGPTGSGILYGKESELLKLPPYQAGGEMIKTVTFEETTYNDLPFKFEAGTPNIEAGIGLAAAVDFMQNIGFKKINEIEHELFKYARERLSEVQNIRFIGDSPKATGVVSFVVSGIHPTDIGTIIDKLGIAVRTGHHCTQPLMDKFEIPGTVRASFAVYNTFDEVDLLVEAVIRAVNMLK